MSHGVGIYTLGCLKCRRTFKWPSLGDMTYGEILLHGERGTVHRYVSVLNYAVVWNTIGAVINDRSAEGSALWWRILAVLADAVEGQQLAVDGACPHCRADSTNFRTPQRAAKTPERGGVDDATFDEFLALSESARRERVVAAAGEGWPERCPG
jgi:hypothetical protein